MAVSHHVTKGELEVPQCVYFLENSVSGLVVFGKSGCGVGVEIEEVVFRAVVHGRVGAGKDLKEGDEFVIEEPVNGVAASTKVKIVSFTSSRNSPDGWLTTVDAIPHSAPSGVQIRSHMFTIDHPVIGVSRYTKPHRTCQGRGTYMAIISVTFRHPRTGELVQLSHEEPTKFGGLRTKETKFTAAKEERDACLLGGEVDGGTTMKNPAYITGVQTFHDLIFTVTPSVMIPRLSSQILVTSALHHLASTSHPSILDMGTGSGCLLISLLHALTPRTSRGVGMDLSMEALEVAKGNARRLGVDARFVVGEFGRVGEVRWEEEGWGGWDAVVCNPPYLNKRKGMFEVKDGERLLEEPELALIAGETGYEAYLSIREGLRTSPSHNFAPNCRLFLEVGHGMAQNVIGLFNGTWQGRWKDKDTNGVREIGGGEGLEGWRYVETLRDHRGLERCVVFEVVK
ncbi:S-adenosyl-L-methionine-dependent methyltransferase [Chytridium lagenaria]|nr:S-adenosyl-L-methionine-dependent methyltransferase [Chytridium lagenaria]